MLNVLDIFEKVMAKIAHKFQLSPLFSKHEFPWKYSLRGARQSHRGNHVINYEILFWR